MLTVHYYTRTGTRLIDCSNVYEEDVRFFEENNVKVSMEELNDGTIVCYGAPYENDNEDTEVLVFDEGRNCHDTLHALVEEYKIKHHLE